MIELSDHPFDISEIISEYPPVTIERRLLYTMSESNSTYRYDDLNQLKFELRLRREIVNAASELNRSDFSFAVFLKSKCNPEYWDRTANGGFRLKEGVKPSSAIKDILINGNEYATECATAMMIVYYIALLNVFSEDIFNNVFSQIYLMNWHSLDPLLKEVGIPKVTDILIGDRAYFNNPDVDPETPEWQGENVIVMPDELYYGHGIGITTARIIIYILNSKRKEDATQTAYFMDDTAVRPDFKKLAKVYYNNRYPQTNILYWKPFPEPINRN